jgi:hypothetical protein
MTIKEKLEEYDLFDQAITRHGMLECIRDYEVIGYISGLDFGIEVQFIFKGCVKVDYNSKVAPEHYSMDDRLLDLERQNEPDYPIGFIWGVNHAVVYPGWTLKQDTDELKKLEKTYGLKFYEIYFETNAYDLTITFHDIETKEIKRIDNKKNAL